MPPVLDPQLKRVLAERIKYYNQLGIYDFYRRPVVESSTIQPEQREQMNAKAVMAAGPEENIFEAAVTKPESTAADPAKALAIIREGLGLMAGLYWDLGEPDTPVHTQSRASKPN